MRTISKIFSLLFILMLLGCDDDALLPSTNDIQSETAFRTNDKTKASITTGDVDVIFYANKHGNHESNSTESDGLEEALKYAQVIFNAHEPSKNNGAKGTLEIIMKDSEGLVKRSFVANVFDVVVYPDDLEARFLAKVISDSKTDHSGEDHGDEGTTETGNHTGGNGSGGNHTDGEEHTDTDHSDGDDHSDGGPGEEGHSGGTRGNQSRVDQIVAVSVYDGGSPGTNGDEIHWKWFGGNNPNIPTIDGSGWGNLCDKEIVGGNLAIHVK